MSLSLARNAIAFLIDLAERGEIDPWDVKVIDVIDRFLSDLQPKLTNVSGRSPYEANLSQSGQAFLYASMLVLLKADSLARMESAEEASDPLEEDEFLLDEAGPEAPLPPNLERRLHRRAAATPPQNRRVTLKELIEQLELIAAAMAEHQPRPRPPRPRPHSRARAVRAITELAHQENLSEIAAILEKFLSDRWDEISQGQEWLDFDLLLGLWPNVQPELPQAAQPTQSNTGHAPENDRVSVFWALLFLSAQSKVELAQTEFYQDLKVRNLLGLSTTEIANLSVAASPD
ncbi:MAG: segregation/condensation protein A [Cyanothece sp. SIO1E1]|nr:segregation/condensation protein A [Cyanothece sp. SIO1E1]